MAGLRLVLPIALLALAGAALIPLGSDGPQGPTHRIVRGDTLSKIARDQKTTVKDLRRWNGLEGDLIEAGRDLFVAEPQAQEGRTLVQLLRDHFEAWGATDARTTAGGTGPPQTDILRPKRRRKRSRGRGGSAPSTSSAGPGQPMLLPGSEEWPETEVEPQWPALHMPEPKPCLAADAQLSGDRAFGRSQGFSPDQIKGAVAAFQEQTLRCYEGHEDAEGDLRLHFVVGCDGIVRSSSLAEDQSNDPDFAACVARVFGHAPFPAHARDTVEFQVPLSFVADTSGD